jgi:hypothetical protein
MSTHYGKFFVFKEEQNKFVVYHEDNDEPLTAFTNEADARTDARGRNTATKNASSPQRNCK